MSFYRALRAFVRMKLWILDGSEVSSGDPLRILYAGSDHHKNYIARLVYDSKQKEEYLGEKYFWSLYLLIKKFAREGALIIIEGNLIHRIFFKNKRDFFIPRWLKAIVPLPIGTTSHSANEDLRRIRKNNLSYSITRSPDLLHDFYYNMYRPYIQLRHRESAILMKYDVMMKKLRESDGALFNIELAGEYVAGILILNREKIPRLWFSGVRDGNSKYLKKGVIAATYWFPAQHLAAKGHTLMHMGMVRGFLHDGVMQYKKKWGARFGIHSRGGFIIKPSFRTQSMEGFFINNPFAYLIRGQLHGAVFIENDKKYSMHNVQEMKLKYHLAGLQAIHIFCFDETKGKIVKEASI